MPMKVHGPAAKAIRTAQGRSLRDVASKAGLHFGYLTRVESGEKGATEETIGRLADSLGVDPGAISYPDEPIVQATPDTVARIAEFLSVPVEVVPLEVAPL
jgi:transcriptional regulator with XRE-family HTH domain